MRKTSFLLLLFCCLSFQAVLGQPMCSVTRYDETDGVSSAHITQLLQDEKGFLWFATWNGLCRYDGYEFRTFKSEVGDGCHMLTDRIRNILLLPKGRILCQVDEDYFLFDIKSSRFRDLTRQEKDSVGQYGRYVQSRSVQRKPYVWTDATCQYNLSHIFVLFYFVLVSLKILPFSSLIVRTLPSWLMNMVSFSLSLSAMITMLSLTI